MKITLYPKYLIRSIFIHNRHGFFKAGYKILYPEYSVNGMTPWQHYVMDGKRKGYGKGNCNYERIFFPEGYELEYPDVKAAGEDAWRHYAEKGLAEGRDNGMHPKDEVFFAAGYLEMYPDVARSKTDPWHHYALHGQKEGRDNGMHPKDDVFFAAGYLEMYPDVARSKVEPWRHYVLHGQKEGRDNGMHPKDDVFFAAGYIAMYPGVAKSASDAWRHYVLHGKKEGLDNGLHPDERLFFPDGYLAMYQDIAKAKVDPWRHYALYGKKEGRDNGMHPSPRVFNAERYYLNYPEVKRNGADPWRHYVLKSKVNDYFDDYYLRLRGQEQEIVRSIYLSPYKLTNLKRKLYSKKALLIGHEFSWTGATLCLMDIAKILLSDGYHVDIAVMDLGKTRQVNLYDGIGADVFMLPVSTECLPNAEKIVKNYDLVIINTILMAAYAELCRHQGIPHIWFVHEDLPGVKSYFRLIKRCEQRFFDDYENILLVSKYVSDSFFDQYKIRCRYINNFINDKLSDNDSQNQINSGMFAKRQKTFAVVGTVKNRKAQDTAAAAFLVISAKREYKDRWKLFFIGTYGRDAQEPSLGIKLESATKNISNIVWCGQITENKWDFFKNIDFFIIPSREESSSLVAIEAAMLGKPVIATTHVGAKYLTENNAGFLFEPGDISGLRDVIQKCIDMDEDQYKKISRQIRRNYEKTSTLEVYHKAFSEAVNKAFAQVQEPKNQVPRSFSSYMYLRSMCSGGNVFHTDKFEYVKYVDFARLEKQPTGVSLSGLEGSSVRDYSVGVVIPVFNGIQHLKVLIPSLFKNTSCPHKFIFVDDCSDAETADFLLAAVSNRDDCILIRNDINQGFVKSVNKGAQKALEYCGNFVMLNSDTEVPAEWLERLVSPIFNDDKISSVTPLSNRATAFSFPFLDSDRNDIFLKEFGVDGINSAIRNSAVDKYVNLPTGHGFCMAISGNVWKKIGGLNEDLFGRGYGEENEWSLRAELDGFKNILISNLYVAHHEKGSFSDDERKANCAASSEIISVMFPEYRMRVREYIRERPAFGSAVSIFLSLARQRGYETEFFTDPDLFMKRMSGKDGIFVIRNSESEKIAIKILGETIFVGNAKNLKIVGINFPNE